MTLPAGRGIRSGCVVSLRTYFYVVGEQLGIYLWEISPFALESEASFF